MLLYLQNFFILIILPVAYIGLWWFLGPDGFWQKLVMLCFVLPFAIFEIILLAVVAGRK